MANPYIQQPQVLPEDQPQIPAILRSQALAQQLMDQAREPMSGQMVSGHYVAPSWTQGAAKLAQAYFGQQGLKQADEKQRKLAEALAQKRQEWAGQMPRAQSVQQQTPFQYPMMEGEAPIQGLRNVSQVQKMPTAQDYMDWSMRGMQIDPNMSQFGMNMANMQINRDTQAQARQDAREQRMAELQMRLSDARTQAAERAQLQRELAQMQIEGRKELAAIAAANRPASAPTIATIADPNDPSKSILIDAKTNRVIGNAPGDKNAKLPSSALKMQQEELDNIATSSSIKSDIGALKQQLEKGELQLGPVKNILSQGKNIAGMSDQTSRNFASFRATIEKLRNDSLRLNKGVQTEGDAIRAWNELISNINDPAVVRQRLDEIERINDRAVGFRRMNIDTIRQNFGVAPMEISGYEKPPAAVGAVVSPQDKQALEWANKNPNDPRAAQIKQRLGAK